MQTHDYLTCDTVFKLSLEEFEKLRLYLKILGYRIDSNFGNYREQFHEYYKLILDQEGDLSWWMDESYYCPLGKEYSYEEIIKLVSLAPV